MSSQITLKASGLNYSPNNLSLPEGSLVIADDVIVRRDNVVESRRGYNEYSEGFGLTSDRSKQLLTYKDRILNHYTNKLAFDSGFKDADDKAIFYDFSGSYTETQTGLRIKYTEANKNLYFTTDKGIKKISARTAADFTTASGYITDAGGTKSLDFTAILDVVQGQTTGFLPADSTVAYRTLWGYKDVNENLILGTPSDSVSVYNYLSNLLPLDINTLCDALDNVVQNTAGFTSVIHNTNTTQFGTFSNTFSQAFNTPVGADATTIKNNVVGIAENLDEYSLLSDTNAATAIKPLQLGVGGTIEIFAGNNVTITFAAGDPRTIFSSGDKFQIYGVAGANLIALNMDYIGAPVQTNTYYTIIDVTATTITFVYTPKDETAGNQLVVTAATAPTATTQIYPYKYRDIINTRQSDISSSTTFQYSLVDQPLDTPPTADQLKNIQTNISLIIQRLQSELSSSVVSPYISSALKTRYIDPLSITTNANTTLSITIPTTIINNPSYFLQIYRTAVNTATGVQSLGSAGIVSVTPGDEMRLVYEGFPTATDWSNGYIVVDDTYPEDLANVNANLYTNPTTGEGIGQANDIPPIAKDINRFKNVNFYANTKTRHRLNPFQLFGTSDITSVGHNDKIVISDGTLVGTQTYTFVTGVQQVTRLVFDNTATPAQLKTALQSNYFSINSGQNQNLYYVGYLYDNAGSITSPPAGRTALLVNLLTNDTFTTIRDKTLAAINTLALDFTAVSSGTDTLNITNINEGITAQSQTLPASIVLFPAVGARLTITTPTVGAGEDSTTQSVLLSQVPSRAQAIDLTARSLARVINKQTLSPVNAYYVSGDNTPPGLINLESKVLVDIPFYVMASGDTSGGLGASFTPDISPYNQGTTIAAGPSANTATLTSTSHGLNNADIIVIAGSNSTNIVDGIYSVSNVTTNTFDIDIAGTITVAGTYFAWSKESDTVVSNNENKPNRIYYSKINEPEAVPILNYFDVGSQDKEILRIFPLRDSLFVFKEDGLYRISGQSAPFVVDLFDSSCVLVAPDSVDVANNIIYGWTTKGISNITEAGVNEVSRPVDTQILKLSSSSYTNFSTLTWGVGYDSDNSYTVYTNSEIDDEYATVAFRYSNLTNSWTNYIRSQTCGVILDKVDKLYMGSGDYNLINQERKNFDRTDYSDRDFNITLDGGNTLNSGLKLIINNVSGIEVGDAIIQTQYLTIYEYNSLLQKLDIDPTVGDDDYFSTLEAKSGDNLRLKILALAAKLDTDPGITGTTYALNIGDKSGSITLVDHTNPSILTSASHGLINDRVVLISGTASPMTIPDITGKYSVGSVTTNTFTIPVDVTTGSDPSSGLSFNTLASTTEDIRVCYNYIVTTLNLVGSGTTFKDYDIVTDSSLFEAIITNVNENLNIITVNLPLQWVVGDMKIYKAIPCFIQYAPVTFGNALMIKQIYEATVMLADDAFTKCTTTFSSDLKPEFSSVDFYGQGNGIFGHYSNPGFGFGFFGGSSNAAPLRTIIPRQTQRCRYINLTFEHKIAREIWSLYGITLTGNIMESTRGYR